ncbi:MAG: ribbon-helix-helix domain-containing protein [Candidatus Methanoperedens sp.]|nr:ribbon-helix-helix domain-containing protein [Candidatus Methanoperedens sp.]
MAKIKTSIALDEDLLKWVDMQIEKKRFANRTHAIEFALQQLVERDKIESEKPTHTHVIYPETRGVDLAIAEKRESFSKKR